ncbi:prephenate dehydrogenase/arogenate dehydrogenase family protein [Conexibacter sp. JD483]|uniref:prephenate dehydrogenase/arogenate dehydrogenase family protein n=1 Tax=unclassified Conexibacter TaxID=2627773 RepID=UPI0027225EF3|nr:MULTISPECIES: prephenate dehydrogenase/arogenate dehydrogenase family protein [unclassified Conexibacter]MDO8184583.1 prephenate dehydrogenase/arogenate dehydrogenase family protein [Conexibacter sp. CPCC 205706]MDO8197889.1 prephenate dehydrogenase/arogenate dehydrogenase family protein [Conexibacter sp. CPCC 205762]MDR9370065.1 prephenate dehydrogenase/arogenate dehydrogenase family protein [Conexibacter sp. JD483]
MRITIVGVGLIGGSIGLAARERLGADVTGWDPNPAALDTACARGALDRGAASLEEAVNAAEVVFAAAPVGQLPATVERVLAAMPADCVVTDVGSTKRSVVAAIDDPRFVGGHPLAGAETAGVEHARGDLFQDAVWYLTPTHATTGTGFERLHRLLRGLGALPTTIDAATHDTMLAAVSHLPHAIANVMVAQAARALEEESEQLPATGPSFRDATRVAGANSAIWTDIYLANRDALIERIDDATRRLTEFRRLLEDGDASAVTAWNDGARDDRRRLLEAQLAGGPLHELRASVPNEPGVIARLALELGRAGVNITDMALYPAPNQAEGVVALWIAGDEPAERALALIEQQGFPVAEA